MNVKLNMVICSGGKPHCAEGPQASPDCADCHHALPHYRDSGCKHICWTGVSSDEHHTCHTLVSVDQWWEETPDEPEDW